jgi:hypothetical protein
VGEIAQRQCVQLKEPFIFKVNGTFSLRLYPDSRPENMEIAPLQKGLVLVVDGEEVIEEGVGFGVPVLKYSDKTFFCKTAVVCIKEQNEKSAVIEKVFLLDSVSKKRLNGAFINDGFYSVLHKIFEVSYLRYGKGRSFFDWIMRLRKLLGIETYFAKVSPRGIVTFQYYCYPDHIKVSADFSGVDLTQCREILVLNEQGGSFFRRIRSGDLVSQDKEIGAWVKSVSGFAEFSDFGGRVSFSVERKGSGILYVGWEQVKGRFSWAGINFGLSPKTLMFNYTIRLKENALKFG